MPTTSYRSDASADEPKQSPGAGISLQELDALTLGAFSASTSAERVSCLQQWLAKSPPADQLQSVYRALSHKDKGAAKLDRKSTRLNSSHSQQSRMPSSA